MPIRPATAGKEEAFMKRSWRTGRSIHSMTGGTCQVDDPKAGREEKLPALAGTDVIAPYQYGRIYQQRRVLPEKSLMRAILDNAIAEFHRYAPACDGKGKRDFREVEAWILNKETDWVFSFESICGALGFDADYLRWGLQRWRQVKRANALGRSAAQTTARVVHAAIRTLRAGRRKSWVKDSEAC